ERAALVNASAMRAHYSQPVDRESAYEKLQARANASQPAGPAAPAGRATAPEPAQKPMSQSLQDLLLGTTGPRGGHHEGMLESAAKSAARSVGSGLGRQILRGVLGSLFGGKR
ncbi:MAG TPA: helicase HerA-like domain-containing protein, partial [Vicinamibacterales bacterium]|nr:helicase HerA-like domain-containing protein [Vicinamibacterales bacterium]